MVPLRVGRALPEGPDRATAKIPMAWGRLDPNHTWGAGGCKASENMLTLHQNGTHVALHAFVVIVLARKEVLYNITDAMSKAGMAMTILSLQESYR